MISRMSVLSRRGEMWCGVLCDMSFMLHQVKSQQQVHWRTWGQCSAWKQELPINKHNYLRPNLLWKWERHLELGGLPLELSHLVIVVNESHVTLPCQRTTVNIGGDPDHGLKPFVDLLALVIACMASRPDAFQGLLLQNLHFLNIDVLARNPVVCVVEEDVGLCLLIRQVV